MSVAHCNKRLPFSDIRLVCVNVCINVMCPFELDTVCMCVYRLNIRSSDDDCKLNVGSGH